VSRFFVELVRVELLSCILTLENRLLPWRRCKLKGLAREKGLHLNVGCGPHVLPGFVNLDLRPSHREVIALDCRRGFPFTDHSVAGIRAEHFFEHLEPREEVPAFLAECRRVLAEGGVLRIVVPDAERYLRAYCRDDLSGFRDLSVPEPFPEDLPTRMDIVNHTFHQWHEHRWGYDLETLVNRLQACGFARATKMSFRSSLDPELASDREEHAPYSLYVDAVR
jgi:predicted SAM-dependent methyltransferase